MKLEVKISYSYIIIIASTSLIIAGSIFFIPNIMVERFQTPPTLWIGIITGIMGVLLALLSNGMSIYLPTARFSILISTYALFRIINGDDWGFLLMKFCYFLILFNGLNYNKKMECIILKMLFSLALSVALFGIFQYIGFLPSFHSTFLVTGPFNNPAGIACLLAVLFPLIFIFLNSNKPSIKIISIIIGSSIIGVILLSDSRTALFSIITISAIYYFKKILHWKFIIVGGCALLSILYLLYMLNPNSANGRFLIWTCCFTIITNNIWAGIGIGNFQKEYMMSQAHFFTQYPDSSNAMLAGNIQHPFNELIGLCVEQGIIGVILVTCIWGYIIRNTCQHYTANSKIIVLILLSFAICSFFSYPFHFPAFHILLITFATIILNNGAKKRIKIQGKMIPCCILLLSSFLICDTIRKVRHELKWGEAFSAVEEKNVSKQELKDFSLLYNIDYLRNKGDFLYNYAVLFYEMKEYKKCIHVLESCKRKTNDYDVQLLTGYSYLAIKNYEYAERAFQTAANMIPNRVIPKYELMKLYASAGNTTEAVQIAQKITKQPLKKESPKTLFMKQEAIEYMLNHFKRKEEAMTQK